MQLFWEKLDRQGWSLHHMHYDMYEGEGVVTYQTENLLEGFLTKLDFFRRFSFGSLGIYGEEPNL
jgi:hypothetical protein